MSYYFKRGRTVHFKLKKSYRIPVMTGVIENSCDNLVWIKTKEVQGKKVNKETVVCVHKRNIY